MSSDVTPYIQFFRERRDLFRDAEVVADIAVLRSFPSQVLAGPKYGEMTARTEQSLIEHAACFQIIYDHHLADLARYRYLVLAGCVALSDAQVEAIMKYVENGGQLGIIGPLATHDEWMRPRAVPALADLPLGRVTRFQTPQQFSDEFHQAWANDLTLSTDGPVGLCSEVTEQAGKRLVHLVNYRQDGPVRNVRVQLRVPREVQRVTLATPGQSDELTEPFEQVEGIVRFIVPEVAIYEVAVIDYG